MSIQQPARKQEIIAQLWTDLREIWKACPDNDKKTSEQTEIDNLFPTDSTFDSGPDAWHLYHRAEQAVGRHLGDEQLKTQYVECLRLAHSRNLPNYGDYLNRLSDFDLVAASQPSLKTKRETYFSLLRALQLDFIQGRYRRHLRIEVAIRLYSYGVFWGLFALAVMAVVWLYLSLASLTSAAGPEAPSLMLHSVVQFFVVCSFGILGAFFSRALLFQDQLETLSFDDVMKHYQPSMLNARLMYGMICAVIFYFVLRSGLMGGLVFPDFKIIDGGKEIADAHTAAQKFSGAIEHWMRLAIWSLIAGFLERMVPDTLGRIAQSDKPLQGPAVPPPAPASGMGGGNGGGANGGGAQNSPGPAQNPPAGAGQGAAPAQNTQVQPGDSQTPPNGAQGSGG